MRGMGRNNAGCNKNGGNCPKQLNNSNFGCRRNGMNNANFGGNQNMQNQKPLDGRGKGMGRGLGKIDGKCRRAEED